MIVGTLLSFYHLYGTFPARPRIGAAPQAGPARSRSPSLRLTLTLKSAMWLVGGLVEDFVDNMDAFDQDLLEDFMLVIDDGIEIA